MIKGHYIATVVIDVNLPEDTPNLLPLDEMRKNWETLDECIKEILENEFRSEEGATISVTKRYSHLYKSEDKA